MINSPYESLPSIHFHHGQLWSGTPPHFFEHFYNDFDDRADDVWLISYPRSGTAWAYEIIYAVLYEGDITALRQAQSEGKILSFLPLEISGAASVSDHINTWKALPLPRVVPTHLPYRLFPKTVLERKRKRIHVWRNPKDVAVSFYHFHRSLKSLGCYRGTWDDFFEYFISGQVVGGSWFDHVLEWWPSAQEDEDAVLALHYEDMKQDLAAQVRRLGAFLGKDLSSQAIAAIEEHGSFQSMSANPFTNREGNPIIDLSISSFLRKGVIGDWKTHFTEEQNERFNALWEQKMAGNVDGQRCWGV
ncbi:MAG: sulfotransferase domain-containing protein [Egibacteraceae bacterium]